MVMAIVAMLPPAFVVPQFAHTHAHHRVEPRMNVGEEAAKAAWLAKLAQPSWGNAGNVVPTAASSATSDDSTVVCRGRFVKKFYKADACGG